MPLGRALLEEIAADPEALAYLRELVGGEDGEGWIGVAGAAEHLGCKRQRIYNLVSDRAIPFRKDGARVLFRRSELDAWLNT